MVKALRVQRYDWGQLSEHEVGGEEIFWFQLTSFEHLKREVYFHLKTPFITGMLGQTLPFTCRCACRCERCFAAAMSF